ncbi:4644_t:CDS:2 [Diversispora eburnea]|uniref:4644_t:CDS:1 n=1 Tax=Diversispora eburnea TaxID=1213867 RepID=A0A9N8ZQL8_9GLOM|nr:4644_t:CDS:2 [Diversispora eburnea]
MEQIQNLHGIVEEERNRRMAMQVEFIANVTAYLNNFETNQAARLKASVETVQDSISKSESNPRLVSNVSSIKENVSSQLDAYKNAISSTMVSLDALSANANEETTKLHRQHIQSFEELTTNVTHSYSNIQNKMFNSRQELENNANNVLELNLFNDVSNRLKRSREEINTFESDKLQSYKKNKNWLR